MNCKTSIRIAALLLAGLPAVAHAEFAVQRVLTGLNQPVYVTQAPGDNANLFIVERRSVDGSLGDIVKYNRLTGASSTFLDLPGTVLQGGGMLGMAFHPDFQTNGLFYVNSFANSNVSKLEEYKVVGNTPALQRTIMQYTNPSDLHPMDWIGFQPGATGPARNYLYMTTGDGGIQANEAGFLNRGQDPKIPNGKMLRLDINPLSADAYPGDSNKNFAIPLSNPFVSDNTGKLKEIFQTGFRNPWRASFDHANGDLYVADVGFDAREEINFTQNGASFNSGMDFGWAKREGTIAGPNGTFAGAQGSSINPIYEIAHPTFRSITGGYVYRGPISELQGKYIFGDFNSSAIRSLNFDRNTSVASFNGATGGISNVTDITALLNAKISGAGPITALVSFGEDNAGNLFVLAMTRPGAGGSIFNPPLGTGELYMISPLPADANTDGNVDLRDLYALATHWQQPGDFTQGDFNFDGLVNSTDLTILAQHWQDGVAGSSLSESLAVVGLPDVTIPEPSFAAVLLSICWFACRPKRRRCA